MTKWAEPPAWFTWLSATVIVWGAVIGTIGAIRIGVTVDEAFHVTRLSNYLDHGWYMLDDDFESGESLGAWVNDAYVYGPVSALLLHVLNVMAGQETWSEVSTTAESYVVRHLGVLVLGALSVASASAMARILSGSARWAIVAAAVLVAMPMWTGYAMFNVKDVPVATGYSFVTLACMMLLVAAPESRRLRLLAVVLIVAGSCLAIGTRPGIWPGLAFALTSLAVAPMTGGRSHSPDWWRLRDAIGAVLVSLIALVVVYPVVFMRPERWLMGSASESVSYRGDVFRSYVLHEVTATMPLLLLFLAVVGSLVRFRGWLTRAGGLKRTDLLMMLVLAQALLLPLLLFFRPAALSGGLRHVLFSAPAVAVLATAAIATVMADQTSQRARMIVVGLASIGLAIPMVVQTQLLPFGYAYVNLASDLLSDEVSADHWRGSLRAYARTVPEAAFVVCGPELDEEDRPLRRKHFFGESMLDASQDCASPDRPSVLQPYLLPKREKATSVAPTFIALVVKNDRRPLGCTELNRVERRRLFLEIVVSRALLCPLVLPDYEGPVTVDGAGAGAEYLLGGWTGHGGRDAITVEDRASLGFELAGSSGRIDLMLTGRADGEITFLLNNMPAEVRKTASGWQVGSTGPLAELGHRDNVVLTVSVDGGSAHLSRFETASAP